MNSILTQLYDNHQIWRGNNHDTLLEVQTTGYPSLDAYLCGGFPDNSVIELQSLNGIGELRLIMPYLAKKTAAEKRLIFISPPSTLSSQMLHSNQINPAHIVVLADVATNDALWSAEQCLKSGCVGVVVLWHQLFSSAQVKRLKLAAQQGHASLIIIRQKSALSLSLAVPLCLSISPDTLGLRIAIIKQLGHWPKAPFTLDMRRDWPDLVEQARPTNVISLNQRKVG